MLTSDHKWASLFESLDMFSDDFIRDGRDEQIPQELECVPSLEFESRAEEN